MNTLRKTVIGGLVGLGLVGSLATGVGLASAATTPTPSPTPGHGAGSWGSMHGTAGDMMGGMMSSHTMPIAAAATYLGLSQTDLQTQMAAGQSLADIAKARGKSISGLQDALGAAMAAGINSSTTLSQTQKTAMITTMKSHVAAMVAKGSGCLTGGATGRDGGQTMMGGAAGAGTMMGGGVV